jgi:hypothetical protein
MNEENVFQLKQESKVKKEYSEARQAIFWTNLTHIRRILYEFEEKTEQKTKM